MQKNCPWLPKTKICASQPFVLKNKVSNTDLGDNQINVTLKISENTI